MNKKISVQMLTTMALLIALMVVLTRVAGINTQFFRISFTFVPMLISGMLFGPFWTGIAAVIADLAGMAIFSAGTPFFPGFTLNAFLTGLIYGYFFYKKDITWKNAILATVVTSLIIHLCLTPIWLMIMYKVPLNSWIIWAPRLTKEVVMVPVQSILFYVVGRAIPIKYLTRNLKMYHLNK